MAGICGLYSIYMEQCRAGDYGAGVLAFYRVSKRTSQSGWHFSGDLRNERKIILAFTRQYFGDEG